MKKTVLFVAVLALSLATLAPMAGAAPIDFRGHWSGVDASDGSNLSLSVLVRRPYQTSIVHIYDDSASACEGGAAMGTGNGDPSGKNMTVEFTVRCEGSSTPIGTYTVTFFAQPGGTLTDTAHPGTVWYSS